MNDSEQVRESVNELPVWQSVNLFWNVLSV